MTMPVGQSDSRGVAMRAHRQKLIWLVAIGSILLFQSQVHAISMGRHPNAVSMAVLLAHPEQYKDQTVRFYAFCVFQFEESSLYLSQLHAELMDSASELPLLDGIDHSELNGRLVEIEAVFRVTEAFPHGYLDSTVQIAAARKVRTFKPTKDETGK